MYEQNNMNGYGTQQNVQNAAPDQNAYYSQQSFQQGPVNYNQPASNAPKKPSGFAKVMMAMCLGLLFGLFAGAGFYAVLMVTGRADQTTHTTLTYSGNPVNFQNQDSKTDDDSIADMIANGDAHVTVLTTEQSDITGVVADVMPAMVSITEYYTYSGNYWGQTFSQDAEASGSGIIIGETEDEYIIVTNNHVIEDAERMVVTFIDGSDADAHMKGTYPSKDVAVISVLKKDLDKDTIEQIKIAELGNSDALVLGQNVIAIGNALGYGQSVTTGIISALDREVTTSDGQTNNYIQTDAAINPGNSGGALLNIAGQVIGINSNKIGGTAVEGMGYAIPISSVRDIIEELMGRDTMVLVDEDDMGYIGIYMQEVTPEISRYYNMPQGIYISEIVKGGGAEEAGLKVGDIITGFAGVTVDSNDSLKNIMKYYAVGDEVEITYMRSNDGEYKEHTTTVTLGEKPKG